MRGLLGRQDEGLQMTKDEALLMCLEYIESDAHERKYVGHAIKAALKGQDESQSTDQAHLLHITIQSAVNIERENCARLCDAYELPDVAQAIRARGHR